MWRFRKIYIMLTVRQKPFSLRNISRVGISKSTVLVLIFRVFRWLLSLKNAKLISIIHLQCLEMVYIKKTISSYKGTMNNGTPLSSYDFEMASKKKRSFKRSFVKKFHSTFDKKMKFNCHALKLNGDDLFKNSSKISTYVTRPFLTMLILEVDRWSLQQLEDKMDCTYYPVDYNFFEIWYCVRPNPPYTNIHLKQASDLILSHFQK